MAREYAERNRRSITAFMGFLRAGKAHRRSLGCARDDKGRVITHLKVHESARGFFCAIRLEL
jgi:hypothetical protein